MLKILQASLQQYMNWELLDIQARLKKAVEPGIELWISIGKATEFQKNIYICFIDYDITFDCKSQQTGNFLKRWEYQTTSPASWETCILVKK